jgi:enhancing lycopene biosynthesis protein 2
MANIPRKAGIVISGGNPWEILFSIFHLEKQGFLRLAISVPIAISSNILHDLDTEIARSNLIDLNDVRATGLDVIIIPGGKRLFAGLGNIDESGGAFKVNDGLKNLLKGIYRLGKPIGAFGPGAAVVAKSLQGITRAGAVVTVGSDPKLQAVVSASGAQAVVTRPGEVVIDQTNKLATSGGELGSKRPSEVFESCGNLVSALLELIKE